MIMPVNYAGQLCQSIMTGIGKQQCVAIIRRRWNLLCHCYCANNAFRALDA